jgi:hypothetical protein
MGTSYLFTCKKCGYQVRSSGGKDMGMLAVTDTYICTSCMEIVDVYVGEYGITYKKGEIPVIRQPGVDLDFYRCPECGSGETLIKWSKVKRPCPKCKGRMEKDAAGNIVMWD